MSLVQGTQEWLEWRRKGLGASEMAAVIGECPYSTPLDVFNDKLGLKKAFEGNFATERGSELEAKARARYELFTMEDMPPATAVHPKYEILRASLDGLRSDNKKILEIKCPGKENHEMALRGEVPRHYQIQIQQQLLVTGAESCDYFSYYDKDDSHALIEVLPDIELQSKIVIFAEYFWKEFVLKATPPPLTDRDVKEIKGNEVLTDLCAIIAREAKTLAKKELDALKARAMELGGHPKIKCGNVRITEVKRGGKFSYNKLTLDEAVG